MRLLVLGTRNRKKREEIVEILDGLGLEFGDLNQWPDLPEVEEDGVTFESNARKKATEIAKALSHWVLGEDSGLVVPATKPTIRSCSPSWRRCRTIGERLITFAPRHSPTPRAKCRRSSRDGVTASLSVSRAAAAASATIHCS